MSDEAFKKLVTRAMDELSPEHIAALEHVAILIADEPTPEQAEKLRPMTGRLEQPQGF